MSKTLHKFITPLLLVLSSILLSFHFAVAQDYPNSPIGVTQKYFDAIAANDTNKYLDSVAPEDRQLPGIPFIRQLVQGLASYYGFGGMDAAKISLSFINLTFQETANDGTSARVLVTGSMRDLNLGIESPLNTEIPAVNENGIWYVKLYDLGNQLPTVNTSITYPRDAIAPQTPEQVAAAAAFEQYMTQNGTQYRAAHYNTIQSTTTNAVVEIKMELLDANAGIWVENSTTIPMRLLAGTWRADTSKIAISITEQGQSLLNTQANANAQATQVASDVEGQTYAQLLGGTLLYLLDDNISLQGRKADGSLIEIKPNNDNGVDRIELVPNGNGFYFAKYRTLYFYNFQSGHTKIIDSYDANVAILSISPDNMKIAVGLGSGGSDSNGPLYILSTDSLKTIATRKPNYGSITGIAWSPDSNLFYIRSTQNISVWNFEKENQIGTLTFVNLGGAAVDYFGPDLAISPDGLDLFVGGVSFGVFSINDKTQFDLSGGQSTVACNPVYSTDGSQIITLDARNNWLLKYDLSNGNWTSILQLPKQLYTAYDCPVFDWIPQAVSDQQVNSVETTVVIAEVRFLGDILHEQIDLRNTGGTINLKGWEITDNEGNTYVFSDQTLSSSSNLTIFTRPGPDSVQAVFWNRNKAVFEPGDTVTLYDNNGNAVSTYIVPNK